MGTYFNPDNESFTCDKNSKIYIDKTGLLDYLNDVICTNGKYIAVSHARRFGKSHAAGMIDAYYSRGCDSYELFKDTEIATKDNFRKYMNQYNVIHFDMASVWDFHKDDLIEEIHLGYLGYDADRKSAYIPNYEIKLAIGWTKDE